VLFVPAVRLFVSRGWVSFVTGFGGVMTNFFAGHFYDEHTVAGHNECEGSKCYRDTFALCGGLSVVAIACAIALVPHTQWGKKNMKTVQAPPQPQSDAQF
jgi:predicted MFS family arabinose efflux permease